MTAMMNQSATTELKMAPRGGAFAGGLLAIDDLTGDQIREILTLAASVKTDGCVLGGAYAGALAGLSVTMLFEKPSLRTRMSFDIGLTKLGAHVVYLDHASARLGAREAVKDYAKNLERWTDAIVARVFKHAVLEELSAHAAIPVVNALSDLEHPCQTLADLQTLIERYGSLDGLKVAYVGDGNNVCHSLMLACAKLGVSFTAVTPKGFEPRFGVVKSATAAAHETGATITISRSIDDIKGHHAVYTDTWVSMGQEHQTGLRGGEFTHLQVDADIMAIASEGLEEPAAFMHCLPAHRGEEVTDDVIDSAQSLVYEQADNRMWAQNALMLKVFGKQ
ncbi:MAG: ornithine carbamoyltransferase [Phycisphaeraceae bacterium]|nr:MAG: ornithine carbamoyltransferase [Phycisphaeraceae bacterium]